MSIHDPLCPFKREPCPCDLIARVRADERAKNAPIVAGYERSFRADLRAKVEGLHDSHHAFGFMPRSDNRTCCDVARVLALLDEVER